MFLLLLFASTSPQTTRPPTHVQNYVAPSFDALQSPQLVLKKGEYADIVDKLKLQELLDLFVNPRGFTSGFYNNDNPQKLIPTDWLNIGSSVNLKDVQLPFQIFLPIGKGDKDSADKMFLVLQVTTSVQVPSLSESGQDTALEARPVTVVLERRLVDLAAENKITNFNPSVGIGAATGICTNSDFFIRANS